MSQRIVLAATDKDDVTSIQEELEGYSLETEGVVCGDRAELPAVPLAFLIHPRRGLVRLGEQIADLRAQLGSEAKLVACAPRPPRLRAVIKSGADDLVTPCGWSPAEVADRILGVLIRDGAVAPASLGRLKGATQAMRQVYRDIEVQAPFSDPVLILGESGTGKELVGKELHAHSGRDDKCVTLNCAALTLELFESELFGHERGAFTGANANRAGLIREAGKGTLFLDEIGELPMQAQAKLLRMIEERKVRPVGSDRSIPFEARIVLATNRDLEREVANGNFRFDLLERIRGFRVELPPLRDRRPDIPLLAQHFLADFEKEEGGARSIPSSTMDLLFRNDWPGNVRQLRQVIRVAAAFAAETDGPIDSVRLQEAIQPRAKRSPDHMVSFDPRVDTLKDLQRRARALYIRSILKQTNGNRKAAAERAGISRARFYEILKEIEA